MKQCIKCKEYKEDSEFKSERTGVCNGCVKKRCAAYRERNKERLALYNRNWQLENNDRTVAAQARWRERNPGVASKRMKEWRESHQEQHNNNCKNRNQRIKDIVFEAYGGYECACCGESNPFFLSIDHMNNDGAAHRMELFGSKAGGHKMYDWLIKNNFPEGFQVLCMNCNWGKARNNGICPHNIPEGSETISKESRAKRPEVGGSYLLNYDLGLDELDI